MLRPFVAASCLCAAGIAQGEPARLSGQEIREMVAGATVEIDAPLGYKLPVRFGRDGELTGQAGDLAPYLGAAKDTGKWWVTSDQLCHQWKTWLDARPQCLRLSRQGRTIYWQAQDGNSGTATITVRAPVQIAAAPPPAKAAVVAPKPAPATAPRPPAPVPAQRPEAAGAPPAPQARVAVAESSWSGEPASEAAGTAAASVTDPEPKTTTPPAPKAATPPAPKRASRPEPKTAAQPEPKAPAQPAFMVVNVPQGDVLNVRSGPSPESALVGELPPGSRGVTITGACQMRWCPVEHRSARGWVNVAYLAREDISPGGALFAPSRLAPVRDHPDAPRSCLTPEARALLERIEDKFGPVEVVSTCRPGALIAGTAYPSRHASGNAVDFKAGSRKAQIVEWLIAHHRSGGTMTYPHMDHIHVDIGRHFVSIAGGPHWASWRSN